MTDTLKIPRATIQYTNQDQIRCHNISKMKKIIPFDCPPNSDDNNFDSFSNNLEDSRPNNTRIVRHVSGKDD